MAAPNSPYDEAKCQQTINVSQPPKWNRAIPESGYIRLGSIRYGVKMTVTENGICTPLRQSITAASVAAAAAASASEQRGHSTHSDAISSTSTAFDEDADEDACCCLGTNGVVTSSPCNNDRHRHRQASSAAFVYSPAKCRSTAALKIAQNRIQPSSSVPHHHHHQQQPPHTYTSEPTTATSTLSRTTLPTTPTIGAAPAAEHVGTPNHSSKILCAQRSTTTTPTTTATPTTPTATTTPSATGGHLVIGSRESSPTPLTTCCYYSMPTRIAQPFKPTVVSAVVSTINNKPTVSSSSSNNSNNSSSISSAAIINSYDTTATSGVAQSASHNRRRIPIAQSTTSTPLLSASPSSSSSSSSAAVVAAQRLPSAPSISERLGASAFNYSSHRNSAESSADALSSLRLLGSTSDITHGDHNENHNNGAADHDHDNDAVHDDDKRYPVCVRYTPAAAAATPKRVACTSRHQQVQRTLQNDCYCHNKGGGTVNNSSSSHSAVAAPSQQFGACLEPSLTARHADFTVVVRPSNGNGNNTTCRDYINRSSYQNHKPRQIFGNSIAPPPTSPSQPEAEGQDANNSAVVAGVVRVAVVGGADTASALRRKITPQKIPTIIAACSEQQQQHLWQLSVDDDDHTQITLSPTSTTLPLADRRNGKDNNRRAVAGVTVNDVSGDAADDDDNDANNGQHHQLIHTNNSHIGLKYDDLSFIDSSASDFSSHVADVNEVRQSTTPAPTSTHPQLQPQPPSPTTSTHNLAISNSHTPATPPSTSTTSTSLSSISSGIPKPSLLDCGGPKINSVTFKIFSHNNNHSTVAGDDAAGSNATAEHGRHDRLAAVSTQSKCDDGDVDIIITNGAADCVDTHRIANGSKDADRVRSSQRSQALDSSGRLSQLSNSSCGNSFGAIRATPVRLRSLVTDTADIEQTELRSRSRHFVSEDVFPKSVPCFARAAEVRIINSANSPTMDKRRKTLDRWQRLGFGRRSASNITIADGPTSSSHSNSSNAINNADTRKTTEKTERLREITELLKCTRHQQPTLLQSPPVPPPRKPRSPNPSVSNSGSLVSLAPEDSTYATTTIASNPITPAIPSSTYSVELPRKMFQDSLKALSKSFRSSHQDVRTPATAASTTANELPVVHPNKFHALPVDEEDVFTALPNVESRTSLSAYPSHKHIPHRSASFSQVDYSSGKYIRSALGALKASIMKHKEPSVVDSANLTLPRKKDRDTDTDVIAETDDSVSYIFLTDKPDRHISASAAFISVVEATSVDQLLEPPVPEPSPMVVVSASEIVLDTLCEEEICHQSQLCDEEFLQTATTCLIPVPVYECVGRDWPCGEDEPEVWMNVNEDDGVKHIEEYNVNTERITSAEIRMEMVAEILPRLDEELLGEMPEEAAQYAQQPLPLIDIHTSADDSSPITTPNPPTTSKHNKFERSNTWSCPPSDCTAGDPLPAISVTSGSSNEFDDLHTMAGDDHRKPHTATDSPNRLSTEFVEVRKRHSNEDKPFESSLESINPSPSDERIKRIDKSKRRKGIYIQHDSECWHLAEQVGTSSPIPPDATTASIWSVLSGADVDGSTDALNPLSLVENLVQLGHKSSSTMATEHSDGQSPQSALGSLEPTTPESENSGRLQWPEDSSRQSLTGQSSEEKDDFIPSSIHATVSPTAAVIPTAYNNATPATPDTQHRTPLLFSRSDSVSDTESFDRTAPRERCSQSPVPNDTDLKRYSKRPLRGPYGLMLEAEMKKPTKLPYDEILEELNRADSAIKRKESDDFLRQQKLVRKNSGYLPVPCHQRASSTPVHMETTAKEPLHSNHRRFPSCIDSTTDLKKEFKKMSLDSSVLKEPLRSPKKCTSLETNINAKRPSKEESKSQFTVHRKDDASSNTLKATPELLAQLLKGSSEKLVAEQFERKLHQHPGESITLPTALLKCLDTRTHVVIELFNTETSYVESLEHMVQKYMQPLRSAEHAGLVDKQAVDEIFYMIPALLRLHARFLDDLQTRLNSWSESQTQIGVAFIEAFSDSDVFDTYMTFLNNLHRATATLRSTRVHRPPFTKFLTNIARLHKGKLELDSLLIKPVQKFPSYELILSRLIKYTADDHPDTPGLHKAFNLVHDMLVTLNCKKREEFEKGQREAVVREIEGVIEGVSDLVTPDRQFLLFDLVSIVPASHTGRKDRGLFLFNDLLIVTSIKRRSGNIRKPSSTVPNSVALTLDTNKYKLIMKIPIDDLDIVKIKDDNLQKLEREIEFLANDLKKLQQITDVATTLRCPHQALEDSAKELHRDIQRQLTDRQTNDPQLSILDLSLHSSTELLSWSVMFAKADKKTQWEQTLLELKQKIAASLESPPAPEFLTSIPIRKTRAGLQFTCAAPTLAGTGTAASDVWVCNSDGYVGQVCVLSLSPEPSVTSCNSVCNARILCLQSVPHSEQQRGQPADATDASCSGEEQSGAGAAGGSKSLPDLSSSGDEATVAAAAAASAAVASSSTSVSHVADAQQSTMWLGMEDGYVHVYNCSDNIRIKNTKIKIQHGSAVTDILYLEDQIFVSLANGDVVMYTREKDIWLTAQPHTISVGSVAQPVTQMLRVNRTLWCSANGTVKMLDTLKRSVDYEVRVSDKPITNMVLCGDKVWLSIKNTAFVECYHATNFNLLHKVNLAPQVTKMLCACDEIIRQHKAACLRVTSMLACNNLIWIGTSAGVVLTVRAVEKAAAGMVELPCVTGLPHGHTGHVRVLTCVEFDGNTDFANKDLASKIAASSKNQTEPAEGPHLLVISGGDGYENFRPSNATSALNDCAGREDSTNHLLIWQA